MKHILIVHEEAGGEHYIRQFDSFEDLEEKVCLENLVNHMTPADLRDDRYFDIHDNCYCLLRVTPKGDVENIALKYTPVYQSVTPQEAISDPDLPCYDPYAYEEEDKDES